jgi:hypothetical protein
MCKCSDSALLGRLSDDTVLEFPQWAKNTCWPGYIPPTGSRLFPLLEVSCVPQLMASSSSKLVMSYLQISL